MKVKSAQLAETMKSRREFFGPSVLRLCQEADMVFLALHGANGEDGKVQAAFDLFGIRYTGTDYLSSAVAMDKGVTKIFFKAAGVPTPQGILLERGRPVPELSDCGLEFPVIVKPCCGGSSVGVAIAGSPEEYRRALDEAFAYEEQAVVEEFIRGREFSVAVIGEKAYPVIEIAPKEGFYDYKNKYTAGSTLETWSGRTSGGENAGNAGNSAAGCRMSGNYRLLPSGFSHARRRKNLLPGGQHASRHDAHQPDSPGGGGFRDQLSGAL